MPADVSPACPPSLPSEALLRLFLPLEFQKNIYSSGEFQLEPYSFCEIFPDQPLTPHYLFLSVCLLSVSKSRQWLRGRKA